VPIGLMNAVLLPYIIIISVLVALSISAALRRRRIMIQCDTYYITNCYICVRRTTLGFC